MVNLDSLFYCVYPEDNSKTASNWAWHYQPDTAYTITNHSNENTQAHYSNLTVNCNILLFLCTHNKSCCLRVCGYRILIVNIVQLWMIISTTSEAIMDSSALMAFGGVEVGGPTAAFIWQSFAQLGGQELVLILAFRWERTSAENIKRLKCLSAETWPRAQW